MDKEECRQGDQKNKTKLIPRSCRGLFYRGTTHTSGPKGSTQLKPGEEQLAKKRAKWATGILVSPEEGSRNNENKARSMLRDINDENLIVV